MVAAAAHHPPSPAALAGPNLRERGPAMEMLISIVLIVISVIEIIAITRVVSKNATA
jgi:hypothetical protein